MPEEGDIRRRVRTRRRRLILVVVIALAGVIGGRGGQPALPPLSWLAYVGHFVGGPHSTAANHGYGPPDQIASIPVESYTASVKPADVGVQFVAASGPELRRQHLTMTMRHGTAKSERVPLTITPDGFAGWRLPKNLTPGRYTFQMGSATLGYTPSWTVTLDPTLGLPAPGRQGEEARAVLNQIRAALHLDPVGWSPQLTLAALYHARYVAHYGYDRPSFHVEAKGPLYFGTNPWDRDLRAGWMDASTGEVGIAAASPVPGPLFVAALIDTVYHRLGLLDANLNAVGMASAAGTQTGATMMDLSYVYRTDLPLALVYPPDRAVGIATSWYDNEDPDPVPNGQGGVYGYPITLDMPTVQSLGSMAMALVQDGHVVPTYFDAPGAGDMDPNQAALVPKHPLLPDTTYEVVAVSQNVLFNDGVTRSVAERWSFTTGGAESVYAGVYDGTLYVAVDTPGAFPPGEATTVQVTFSNGPHAVPLTVRVGASGVAAVPLPTLSAGRWTIRAVTSTGNQGTSVYVQR
jgi:uncharacterized protein YkwD